MGSISTRKQYLDILRVIAGIAVVCIHISDPFVNLPIIFGGTSWWIANILNSYARISVPLFVMISGVLLLQKDKQTNIFMFLKRRVLRIIIPLIFWSIFYFIYWRWAYLTPEMVITAYASGKLEHLYFLVIMLGLYILTPVMWVLVNHVNKSQYQYLLTITFLFSLLLGFSHRFITGIAYEANAFTMAFPYICFYLAGHYVSTHEIKMKQSHILSAFLIVGITNAICNYGLTLLDKNNISVLFSQGLGQYVYEAYSPLMIIMTICVFLFTQHIRLAGYLSTTIKNISTHIFGIYLIHPLIISLVDRYLHLSVDSLISPLWMYMFLKIIIVLGISYLLVALGKKVSGMSYIVG